MEPRTELKAELKARDAKPSRFQITKLEERIAPATNNVTNVVGSFNNNAINLTVLRNVLLSAGL
jgi:hypothetical protein